MTDMTTDTSLQTVPAAPAAASARIEMLLQRLEEQTTLQTRMAKKRLFWTRFTALFLIAAVALLGFRVVPAVERTLARADSALLSITTVAQQLEMADIPAILDNLDQTLNESRESLTEAAEAVQEISTIDFDALNTAILDLQKLVQNPLGSLFSRK